MGNRLPLSFLREATPIKVFLLKHGRFSFFTMPNLPSDQSSMMSSEPPCFSFSIGRSRKLERPVDILCFDRPTVPINRVPTAKIASSPEEDQHSTVRSVEAYSKHLGKDRSNIANNSTVRIDSFAAPLAPMRERDLKIMEAWFNQEKMHEIEADFTHYLLLLWPEPCWEDEVFSFLKEYL
ncbi:MAG: hypothetical protein KME16_14205 [Scytolyngbya sp. HA4215-MV1]|nr:hypothetical protein [Scytolyngbya sp. HA4215-MV1]